MDEKGIDILNKLLEIAILHGGDLQGPYYVYPDEYAETVDELIEYLNLQNDYELGYSPTLEKIAIVVPKRRF